MRIRKEARIEIIHRFARGNYRRFRNRVCGHVELRAPRAQSVTGALGSSTEKKKCLLYSIFKEQNFRRMGSNIFFGHAEEVSSFWLAAVRGTRGGRDTLEVEREMPASRRVVALSWSCSESDDGFFASESL